MKSLNKSSLIFIPVKYSLKKLFFEKENDRFEEIRPPFSAYHVTLLSRLPKILKQGLLLPGRSSRRRTLGEDSIYLFTEPRLASQVADDISLPKQEDWVLLKVSNLKKQHLAADEDYGDSWEESIRNSGTFSYTAAIPPNNIEVIATAEGSIEEYHDQFESIK